MTRRLLEVAVAAFAKHKRPPRKRIREALVAASVFTDLTAVDEVHGTRPD